LDAQIGKLIYVRDDGRILNLKSIRNSNQKSMAPNKIVPELEVGVGGQEVGPLRLLARGRQQGGHGRVGLSPVEAAGRARGGVGGHGGAGGRGREELVDVVVVVRDFSSSSSSLSLCSRGGCCCFLEGAGETEEEEEEDVRCPAAQRRRPKYARGLQLTTAAAAKPRKQRRREQRKRHSTLNGGKKPVFATSVDERFRGATSKLSEKKLGRKKFILSGNFDATSDRFKSV
jgi:hypothetical protein